MRREINLCQERLESLKQQLQLLEQEKIKKIVINAKSYEYNEGKYWLWYDAAAKELSAVEDKEQVTSLTVKPRLVLVPLLRVRM